MINLARYKKTPVRLIDGFSRRVALELSRPGFTGGLAPQPDQPASCPWRDMVVLVSAASKRGPSR